MTYHLVEGLGLVFGRNKTGKFQQNQPLIKAAVNSKTF
jgi:hypothetical protein